jgi:hypothetical protein
VGAIQIRKSDGKKRSKHGGTHGIWTKKRRKKTRGVSHCGLALTWDGILQVLPFTIKWRKVVCFVLFCSYEIHRTGCFRSCSLCFSKALNEEGCMSLVPWCLDFWPKSSWILNDFFTQN